MYMYRVENKHGSGPYYTGAVLEISLDFDHDMSKRTPGPYADGLLGDENLPDLAIFGFANLGQLQAWFSNKELVKLREIGYIPRRVKVKNYKLLSTQVIGIREV